MESSAQTAAPRRPRADRGDDSPEAEQRRQMALRHVRQYPDPVLRRTAEKVTVFDDELKALVDRMFTIMHDAHGVGLAAPQLGLLLRLFTYQVEVDDEPRAVVNPQIEVVGDATEVDDEGCLSLGELRVPVERAVAIRVKAQDVDGNPVELELEHFPARVFQHETDHLNGVLAIDRVADEAARKEAMRYLRPKP